MNRIKPKALPFPPQADEATEESQEIMRIWIVDRNMHTTFEASCFEDHRSWGVALADVVRQISRAIAEDGQKNEQIVMLEILEIFDCELEEPSCEPEIDTFQ